MNFHYPMSRPVMADLNRRSALKALGGLGGAGFMGAAFGAGQSHAGLTPGSDEISIDLSDPAQNLKSYIRLQGDLDSSNASVGYYSGTIYNVIGDWKKVTPLCGLAGIGVRRIEPQPENKYRVFNRELAFYSDINTGEFVDVWNNPLNNETVEVLPIQNMTVNAEIAPIFEFDMEGTIVRSPFNPPWEILNGSALALFEVHQQLKSELQPDEWPRESSGEMMRISEMFHRHCRTEDLENQDLTSIPYVGTWMRLAPYLPWMLMGQTEGHLYYRCSMHKFTRVEDLPNAFLEKAEREYPEFLAPPAPESWGTSNNSSFNVYKELRSPMAVKGQS